MSNSRQETVAEQSVALKALRGFVMQQLGYHDVLDRIFSEAQNFGLIDQSGQEPTALLSGGPEHQTRTVTIRETGWMPPRDYPLPDDEDHAMTTNKPCPWCKRINLQASLSGHWRWCAVWCGECEAKGPEVSRALTDGVRDKLSVESVALAFAAWNERA